MRLPRLLMLLAAALLGALATVPGVHADEAYSKTSFYRSGVGVSFIAFTAEGDKVALAAEGRIVHVDDTATNSEIASIEVPSALESNDDYLHFLGFSPDGTQLLTISRDPVIRLWDVNDGSEIVALEHNRVVVTASFSPDGRHLATISGDNIVRLWDVAAGREIHVFAHGWAVADALFSPDGTRLLVTCTNGTAHVWDVAGGSKIAALVGHGDDVHAARFSPDGTRIATASEDGTARIWDARSGQSMLKLDQASPLYSVAFSPDGSRIATGTEAEARVFDVATGGEITVLEGHEYEVARIAFSPDGTRILTASGGGNIHVWDAATGEQLAVLDGQNYGIDFAVFSTDSRRIYTASGAQAIVWTRLEAASLDEDAVGLWFNDFGTPEEPMPPEIAQTMCVTSPIRIDGDGLIVMFDGGYDEPPLPVLHLRCEADRTCHIFAEWPSAAAEAVGEGELVLIEAGKGNLCLGGECRPITKCPAIEWTGEERDSGFAGQWEEAVLGR